MAKLKSVDFLAVCIAGYLNSQEKPARKKFLDFAYTKLHNECRGIEPLETEKLEMALINIEMLSFPQGPLSGDPAETEGTLRHRMPLKGVYSSMAIRTQHLKKKIPGLLIYVL